MLHNCVACKGKKKVDFYINGWSDKKKDIRDCPSCEGKGQLLECQCSAWCSCECICGALDNIKCTCNDD